jgi:hypothetical protein
LYISFVFLFHYGVHIYLKTDSLNEGARIYQVSQNKYYLVQICRAFLNRLQQVSFNTRKSSPSRPSRWVFHISVTTYYAS